MRIRDILHNDWWKDLLFPVLIINTILMGLFPTILVLTGAQNAGYFDIGPPLHIFGDVIDTVGELVGMSIFLFLDRVLETFSADRVDHWVHDIVQNTHKTYDGTLVTDADVASVQTDQIDNQVISFIVFLVRGVVQWMRTVFIVNFFFERYLMLFVYILGDALAGSLCVYYHHVVEKESKERKRTSMGLLCAAQLTEIIIVSFFLLLGKWNLSSYFTFDNPLYFGISLVTATQSNILISLAVFVRLALTLYQRVILTDFYHYTYTDLQPYTDVDDVSDTIEVVFNTFMSYATYWTCYLFSVQLITSSSIKYVVIFAAVDIPVSVLIILVYIWKKSRMLQNIIFLHILDKDANKAAVDIVTSFTLGTDMNIMKRKKKK
jgi:hypothetical protein